MRLTPLALACVLAGCQTAPISRNDPPSEIALIQAINESVEMPVREKAARISLEWTRYHEASDLSVMDDSDLADALLATNIALFYASGVGDKNIERFVRPLLEVHAALDARGSVSEAQTAEVFDQLVALRRFDEARRLQADHPSLAGREIPEVRFTVGFDASAPATMALSPDGSYEVRNEPLLGSRAVFLVGCEMSAKAVEAIIADPALVRALEDANVLWLTGAKPGIGTAHVKAWNARFPHQPMRVAWSNAAWVGLDLTAMPTFHYLQQGRVTELHKGWDPKQTPATIRAALAKLQGETQEGGPSPSP